MKLRRLTDAGVAKTRAFQLQHLIAFATGSFGVWEDEGGVLSALMCFSRKERKGRKEIENQRLRPTIFPEKPRLVL